MSSELKGVVWIASSRKNLKSFPEEVQRDIGFAIYHAQTGRKNINAKPLKGFGGAGVLEVVDDFDGDTYRAIYTVRFSDTVYVLHCFQKKSKSGIATPKHELDLVRTRLKLAQERHTEWQKKNS